MIVIQEPCVRRENWRCLVACPREGCSGSNFERFRFCQWCGTQRKSVPLDSQLGTVDEEAIETRRVKLESLIEDKTHFRDKCKEVEWFQVFVKSRKDPRLRRASVFDAMPSDVIDFFIYRDVSGKGRTIVREYECQSRGFSGPCQCPKRMSAESVRTLVSKLRTRFYELGCAGPWNADTSSGNPADSRIVYQMVTAVREEQAKAGVMVMSARQRALLPQKLTDLVSFMQKEAKELLRQQKFVDFVRRKQDIAWLCVQYRSMNRGAELSALRIGNTVFGPNECCVIFQFTFSKIMRDGASNEFAVQALPEGDMTCPVRAMKDYILVSKIYLGWDWDTANGAFVFPSFGSSNGGARSNTPVSAKAYGDRFKKYLSRAGLLEAESLHGLRASGALTKALMGWSIAEIMQQGYWKCPATALRYIGLLRLIVGDEFVRAVRSTEGDFSADIGLCPQNPYGFLP